MKLDCSVDGPTDAMTLVTVRGEIDLATSTDLEQHVRAAFAGATSIMLDMDGVTFLDSSGIRSLVTLQHEAADQSATLTLRNLRDNVRRVFDLTGLATSFGLDDNH